MPQIRERAHNAFILNLASELGVGVEVAMKAYASICDHMFPEIEKSTPEERKAAYQRIYDWVEDLEDFQEVTVADGIVHGQLKPNSRSDKRWIRQQMLAMGALEHRGKADERFVKRIANGSKNGGAAKHDSTN